MFSSLNIKSKLMLMLLLVSIGSIVVVGYIGWNSNYQALTKTAQEHLKSVRASKTSQIETYFENLYHQIETIAEAETTISAMVHFNKTFKQLGHQLNPKAWEKALDQYYEKEFVVVESR